MAIYRAVLDRVKKQQPSFIVLSELTFDLYQRFKCCFIAQVLELTEVIGSLWKRAKRRNMLPRAPALYVCGGCCGRIAVNPSFGIDSACMKTQWNHEVGVWRWTLLLTAMFSMKLLSSEFSFWVRIDSLRTCPRSMAVCSTSSQSQREHLKLLISLLFRPHGDVFTSIYKLQQWCLVNIKTLPGGTRTCTLFSGQYMCYFLHHQRCIFRRNIYCNQWSLEHLRLKKLKVGNQKLTLTQEQTANLAGSVQTLSFTTVSTFVNHVNVRIQKLLMIKDLLNAPQDLLTLNILEIDIGVTPLQGLWIIQRFAPFKNLPATNRQKACSRWEGPEPQLHSGRMWNPASLRLRMFHTKQLLYEHIV